MSFVTPAAHGASERLHFTRHSQIHERRTVSRAVVKFPWNFDRNYPPPLCTRVRRYFPAVLFRSFHANPRFIPMKLSTPSRDIRFQPASIGLYIKSIFRGNLTSLSNGHFITAILLGTRITYGAVDTTFRGDWIVIDCGIISER